MPLPLLNGVQTCADRKSTRLNSSHDQISYAVFCLKKNIRTLSQLHLEDGVECYEPRLKPGGIVRSSPHFGGTREFMIVFFGQIDPPRGHPSSPPTVRS